MYDWQRTTHAVRIRQRFDNVLTSIIFIYQKYLVYCIINLKTDIMSQHENNTDKIQNNTEAIAFESRTYRIIKKILESGVSIDDLNFIIMPPVSEMLSAACKSTKPIEFIAYGFAHVIENELTEGDDVDDYEYLESVYGALCEINRDLDEYERVATREQLYSKFR